MRGIPRFLVIFLVAGLLAGCGPSPENISQTVKRSMQHTLNTDPQFKKYDLTVKKVQVMSQGGNKYTGLATVIYEGEKHQILLNITADGSGAMWHTKRGAFMFIARDKLQSIFQ